MGATYIVPYTSAGGTWVEHILDLDIESVDQNLSLYFPTQLRAGISARREVAEDGSITFRVFIPGPGEQRNPRVHLKLVKLGFKTRFIGTANTLDEGLLLGVVDRIRRFLNPDKSKLEQPTDTSKAGNKSKRQQKGGRPRNADDDWAWIQVNRLNRPRGDVYPEWLNRIGERAKSLSDPNDTFNKAVKLQRGQGKIPEKTE